MKTKITLLSLTLMFAYIVYDFAKSAGPPPYYTNGPSESACNFAGCHDGVGSTPNTGPGKLSFAFGNNETSYTPGKKYKLTITMTEKKHPRFGFQILVLRDKDNKYSGRFVVTDTINNQLRKATWGCCQERRWIEHTFKGITPISTDTGRWDMEWDAPPTDEGSFTFYIAALAGDGDKTDSFDHNYYTKQTVTRLITGTEENLHSISIEKLYYNSVQNVLEISIENPLNTSTNFALIDLRGRVVNQWHEGGSDLQLSLPKLPIGIYVLRLINENGICSKKILLGN